LDSLRLGAGLAGQGISSFGTAAFGTSRYNTGSHVDVDGFSLMTGLSWNCPIISGNLIIGAFFEGGWGSYNSYNSFNNAPRVHGVGDTSYLGGGIVGRYDFSPADHGHLYLDTSLRAGQSKTDFASDDILNNAGNRTDYEATAAYYGAHLGIGYIWEITEKISLDLSSRFIWTRQESDSVTISGNRVKFKASDSKRLRAGTRFLYKANDYIRPYIGAYIDHEFDGKAESSADGQNIPSPKLKGSTAMGEFGLSIKPSKDSPLTIDLAAQGYTGKREGIIGSLQIKFEF
jgi:outer membrane autotransporter protein